MKHIMRKRAARIAVLCCWAVLVPFAAGCAGKYERALADIQTVDEAERRFGPADSVDNLENGMLRREWSRHIVNDYSGGSGGSYGVSIGGVTGNFGLFLSKWIFDDAGYGGTQECRLVIVSDADGRVVRKSSQGNACDKLMPMRDVP